MQTIDPGKTYVQPGAGQSLLIGGSFGVIFKVLSETTAGSVAVVEHTLPPKALGAAPHRHQHEDELSYVLEGQIAVLQGEDDVTVAGVGAYVVKPRGIFHTFWNPGTEPLRFMEIIAPGGFENYFHELARIIPDNAPPDLNALAALAQRYGLEFDLSRLPELAQRYGVSLGG